MNKFSSIYTFLEPVPLPVFLVFVTLIDFGILHDWFSAYITCTIIAAITSSLLIVNKIPMNRLIIGINLYLFSGSYAHITEQIWLNQLYGDLGASAMIAWIIPVGIISLFFTPTGFIGVKSSNSDKIIHYSVILIITSILAFLLSFYFRDNKIFSEFIPFISLFLMLNKMKFKLRNSF